MATKQAESPEPPLEIQLDWSPGYPGLTGTRGWCYTLLVCSDDQSPPCPVRQSMGWSSREHAQVAARLWACALLISCYRACAMTGQKLTDPMIRTIRVHELRLMAAHGFEALRAFVKEPPEEDEDALSPADCQSCSENADPCEVHAEDWRYWQARALDAEERERRAGVFRE